MSKRKKPAVLVFGEDDNDCEAIRHLLKALRPDMPKIMKRRRPLVLIKGRESAKARKNAARIAAVVRADEQRHAIRAVFAHEDADAIEDAHVQIAEDIETRLRALGVPAIAVVPAFEMETWWFLWPEEVAKVNHKWTRLKRTGNVGRIQQAKEVLRRDLRATTKGKPTRDYLESDGPLIAKHVRQSGGVGTVHATSNSWQRFQQAVAALKL